MILGDSKKVFLTGVLIVSLFSLSGCGQKYESEITKSVKEACYVPDSFKKVDYQVDEKNGIAYIDFKAKNRLGVEIPNRAYFTISDQSYSQINTDGLEKSIAEEFYKCAPSHFAKAVESYRLLKKLEDELGLAQNILKRSAESANINNDNYFIWKSYKNDADRMNLKLKNFKDAYAKAPNIVQSHFIETNANKYVKVNLSGDWFSWSGESQLVNEFPDKS